MSSTTIFLERIKGGCYLAWKKVGILPSVAAAQTILESGWGKSTLASLHNNYWGVKSFNASEPRVLMTTTEYVGGRRITTQAYFRKYLSVQDGFENGYCRTLGADRYKKARGVKDPRTQLTYIKQGGYATDPNYVNLLMGIINDYSILKRWDADVIAGGEYTGPVYSGTGDIIEQDPQGFYTFDSTNYIEVNQYTRPGYKLNGVVGIVIRDAGTPGVKIPAIRKNLANGAGSKKTGFHILIDKTDTTCIVPLNEVVYHSNSANNLLSHLKSSSSQVPNGNMNLTTVSVGICRESDGSFAQETTARLIAVLAELTNHYALPAESIYRGTDVDGSRTPLVYYENFFDYSTMLGLVKYQKNQNTPLLNESLEAIMNMMGEGGVSGGTPSTSGITIPTGNGSRAKIMELAQTMMGWNMLYSQPKRADIRPNGHSDCSSFTQYVYKNTIGIDPGITTHYQIRNGVPIPRSQALPGDLVHWTGHVGIVADVGAIHTIHSGVNNYNRGNIKHVKIDLIPGFIGIRRYFTEETDSLLLAGGGTNTSGNSGVTLDDTKTYYLKAKDSLTVYAGDSNNSTSVRRMAKGSEVRILSNGAFAFRIGDGEWIRRSDSSKFEIRSTDKSPNDFVGTAKILMSAPVKSGPSIASSNITQQGSRKTLAISNVEIPVYASLNNMLLITKPGTGQEEWVPAIATQYSSLSENMTVVPSGSFDEFENSLTTIQDKTVRFVGLHATGVYDPILGVIPLPGMVIGNTFEYRVGSTVEISIPQYPHLNGRKQVNGNHRLDRDIVYIFFENADEATIFGTRIGKTKLISGGS